MTRHNRADGPRRIAPRTSTEPDEESSTVPDEVDGPKGAELDEALEEAGLAKTGSADEKRARLAEHRTLQELADAETENG